MKALVGAFTQEKALVGAFSVITNLRMELFEVLLSKARAKARKLLLLPMMYSPPTTGVPPSALLMAVTSATGPAIREVPVSAMAWHPPLQNVL